MNSKRFKPPVGDRITGVKRYIPAFDEHARTHRQPVGEEDANLETKRWSLRLGHVHIKVRDLTRSVPFYLDMLGLRLTEQVGRFAFLTTGNEHHSIALEEIGAWAIQPPRRAVGVAHVAFEVPDRAAFNAVKNMLCEKAVPFISRNTGTNWTLEVKDPDGHQIQIFLDRRHSPGGTQLWRGRWYGPLKSEEKRITSSFGM